MSLSSLVGKFPAGNNNTPNKAATAGITKRPRESYVCNQCRKSKLRCDRAHPCGACARRSEGNACSYQQTVVGRTETNGRPVTEERLLHLEEMVKRLIQRTEATPSVEVTPPTKTGMDLEVLRPNLQDGDPDKINFPDETTYAGFTHWSTVLDEIRDLKVALVSSDTETAETHHGKGPQSECEVLWGTLTDYCVPEIISRYLPSRVEVDRLLSIYFQGEAFIAPFIHMSHFQRQYHSFWSNTAYVNPLWLSMLFSICCTASLNKGLTAPSASPKSDTVLESSRLHRAAGECLVGGQYHRPQPFGPEALLLYAYCKNVTSLDPSREAGAVFGMAVRLAYEMGYHRDPDSFGSFTVFEGEMRRRFWATCKQMDLMTSFMLGLPSNIVLENCDTKSPRNLSDEDLDTDTLVLPPSRPETDATRLLWFIVKDRQMPSFTKVCRDALSFKEKSAAEVQELDEEIRQMYTTIPNVMRTRPLSESMADPTFIIITRLYIEFIYLKSMCVLHRRYMARGNALSTHSCVEAGKRLVIQFIEMYNEFSPGGQLASKCFMLTNFTMNDFLMGIMVLCLSVHIHQKQGLSYFSSAPAAETEVLGLLEHSCRICVEKSSQSRDAKRVAHAVRVTLGNKASRSRPWNAATESVRDGPVGTSEVQTAVDKAQRVDLIPSVPHLESTHPQDYDSAFGPLDPFNFLGGDFENIDWTMFDAENPSQGASVDSVLMSEQQLELETT